MDLSKQLINVRLPQKRDQLPEIPRGFQLLSRQILIRLNQYRKDGLESSLLNFDSQIESA